jgi:hypothetical protein
VLVEGAVEEIPAAIIAQVKPKGGRLLTIRVATGQTGPGRVGQAVIGEASPGVGGLSLQALFDCTGPLLPAMRLEPGFVF